MEATVIGYKLLGEHHIHKINTTKLISLILFINHV